MIKLLILKRCLWQWHSMLVRMVYFWNNHDKYLRVSHQPLNSKSPTMNWKWMENHWNYNFLFLMWCQKVWALTLELLQRCPIWKDLEFLEAFPPFSLHITGRAGHHSIEFESSSINATFLNLLYFLMNSFRIIPENAITSTSFANFGSQSWNSA